VAARTAIGARRVSRGSARGRARIAARFSIEAAAEAYVALDRSALARGAA
jgi:hypothetical protein